jgi:hypothetical protein
MNKSAQYCVRQGFPGPGQVSLTSFSINGNNFIANLKVRPTRF